MKNCKLLGILTILFISIVGNVYFYIQNKQAESQLNELNTRLVDIEKSNTIIYQDNMRLNEENSVKKTTPEMPDEQSDGIPEEAYDKEGKLIRDTPLYLIDETYPILYDYIAPAGSKRPGLYNIGERLPRIIPPKGEATCQEISVYYFLLDGQYCSNIDLEVIDFNKIPESSKLLVFKKENGKVYQYSIGKSETDFYWNELPVWFPEMKNYQ